MSNVRSSGIQETATPKAVEEVALDIKKALRAILQEHIQIGAPRPDIAERAYVIGCDEAVEAICEAFNFPAPKANGVGTGEEGVRAVFDDLLRDRFSRWHYAVGRLSRGQLVDDLLAVLPTPSQTKTPALAAKPEGEKASAGEVRERVLWFLRQYRQSTYGDCPEAAAVYAPNVPHPRECWFDDESAALLEVLAALTTSTGSGGRAEGPGWTTSHSAPVSPTVEAAARRIAARRAGGAYADASLVSEAAWRSEIHSAEAALFVHDLAAPAALVDEEAGS